MWADGGFCWSDLVALLCVHHMPAAIVQIIAMIAAVRACVCRTALTGFCGADAAGFCCGAVWPCFGFFLFTSPVLPDRGLLPVGYQVAASVHTMFLWPHDSHISSEHHACAHYIRMPGASGGSFFMVASRAGSRRSKVEHGEVLLLAVCLGLILWQHCFRDLCQSAGASTMTYNGCIMCTDSGTGSGVRSRGRLSAGNEGEWM